MFNFLKPKRDIVKEVQEQLQKESDERELAHQKRIEERKKNSNCANIVGELVEYFFNKHVIKQDVQVELIDIINKINSNEELRGDIELQRIIEKVRKCDNNQDALKIHPELMQYHVQLVKKIS